jgi:hypothetical protein
MRAMSNWRRCSQHTTVTPYKRLCGFFGFGCLHRHCVGWYNRAVGSKEPCLPLRFFLDRNTCESQPKRCGLTLMLIALSSTSKIKSRRTRSAFGDGCSTESFWRSTTSGLSANDACMKDKGVMSEPRSLPVLPRGNSKYDSWFWSVVFR